MGKEIFLLLQTKDNIGDNRVFDQKKNNKLFIKDVTKILGLKNPSFAANITLIQNPSYKKKLKIYVALILICYFQLSRAKYSIFKNCPRQICLCIY